MLIAIFAIMLGLFAVGMPVALAMGVASLAVLQAIGNIPLSIVAQRMIAGSDSFPLMAVPFFMLAGELMNVGGVTDRLVRFARSLVGHITGGLSHVVVVTNMLMAGMSGSATADAAGTGSVLIPSLTRAGYPPSYAVAIVGAASTIGPIIPPSLPMVVFGALAQVSIGRLFIGGAIPGLIMGIFLMIAGYILARRRGYGREARASLAELGASFRAALLPLFMPAIVLGGILGGIFTPTEAAAMAAIYAFILGVFVYREIRPAHLPGILAHVGLNTGVVMFIVATSYIFAWVLAREQAGTALVEAVSRVTLNPLIVLLLINVVVLVLGCVMDTFAVLIILVPVVMPLVQKAGIDPVHFGVVLILNLMVGLLTPPVGMVMYVVCTLAKLPIAEFAREVRPFLLALVAVLLLITIFPPLVLWLPSTVMSR